MDTVFDSVEGKGTLCLTLWKGKWTLCLTLWKGKWTLCLTLWKVSGHCV